MRVRKSLPLNLSFILMSDSVVIGGKRVLTFPLKSAPVHSFLEYVD